MLEKHVLSKSTFMRSCQCLKSLYLHKYQPDLRDEISESQEAIFVRGTNVGLLAQKLFPNGVDASPATPYEYQKSVEKTTQLIKSGTEIIYEAAFQFEGVLCAIDILVKQNGIWKAYEVKSTTKVKEPFIKDASLQYYVITNSGIQLSDIEIMYINNKYVRNGEIELDKLFKTESVFEAAKQNQAFIIEQVAKAKSVIKQKEIPLIDIGEHCSTPYPCDFHSHCWKHIPENSVFSISRLNSEKKFELYRAGIIRIEDIPNDYPLNENQRLQTDSYQSHETYIDKPAIQEFLNELMYPLSFLDFESIMPALPLFDYSRPYQQIVFQYSLHYKENANAELQHFSFLADAKAGDPRKYFIEQLLQHIHKEGSIIVYNRAFEATRLKELAEIFPEYAQAIQQIIDRFVDLMLPFQRKQYYANEMEGSYSIKYVLPALVPDLKYDDLAIADGSTASASFENLMYETDETKIAETRMHLHEYCKLDTLAMVRIVEKLKEIIK